MTANLMEKQGELLDSDTPPDDHKHYFRKDDLDRNLLDGFPIKALCGFVKEGLAHIDPDLPVCEKCHWVFENVVETGDNIED